MQTNDIPIWPNATIQFSSSDLFKYHVPGDPTIGQLVDFYQNETRKQGWAVEYEPFRRASQAVLSYKKDVRSMTVIVEQMQSDQVRVVVRVSEHWPVPSPMCG